MPTTAEKLEAMTDTAAFELLAIRVLRETDEDCKALVHLGMNAAGKTIPGPIDGFVKVPNSSPSKYVATAFTTTGSASLERKWLNDQTAKSTPLLKPQGKVKKGNKEDDCQEV